MPLPFDPDYVSTAPEAVQKHSRAFKQLLATGTDPYAPHSYSPTVIAMIESSLVIPPGE
jgi:hypothetical protein